MPGIETRTRNGEIAQRERSLIKLPNCGKLCTTRARILSARSASALLVGQLVARLPQSTASKSPGMRQSIVIQRNDDDDRRKRSVKVDRGAAMGRDERCNCTDWQWSVLRIDDKALSKGGPRKRRTRATGNGWQLQLNTDSNVVNREGVRETKANRPLNGWRACCEKMLALDEANRQTGISTTIEGTMTMDASEEGGRGGEKPEK